MKRLLLALMLLAAQARAADFFVNNNATMATANAGVTAGSKVTIANGTYTTLPSPAVDGATGAGNGITYRGGSGVFYTGSITVSKDFVRIVGGNVSGNVDFTTACISSIADSLTITGSLTMSGGGRRKLSNSVINGGFAIVGAYINGSYPNETITDYADNDTLSWVNGVITRTTVNSANGKGVAALMGFYVRSLLMDHVHLDITINCSGATQDFQIHEYYWTNQSTWRDSYFKVTNNAGDHPAGCAASNVKLSFAIRDSAAWNTMERCTLWTAAGTAPSSRHLFSNSGSSGSIADGVAARRLAVKNCVIWNDDGVAFEFAGEAKGADIQGNVIVSSTDTGFNDNGGMPDSAVFRHNTIVSGVRRALTLADGTITGTKWAQNIVYGRGALAACTGTSTSMTQMQATAFGDSNLYYCSASTPDSGSAIAQSSGACFNPVSYRSTYRWKSPKFQDSTLVYGTFKGALLTGSWALGATYAAGGPWADGYVGALGTATGDVTAPNAVSTLVVNPLSSTTASAAWTSVGDDGATGTATSYDLRYSTATITDVNFASATQVAGEPAPQVAGSAESMTITGLTPSTTYYFAMKVSDEAGNTSTTSNNDTTRTLGTGVIAAIAIGADTIHAGFGSVGVRVAFTGDDDGDSNARIFYRLNGSGAAYDSGVVMQRIRGNRYAGVIFWLSPETSYDCRVVITDPDGGSATLDRTFSTRVYQPLPVSNQQIWVATAAGGGSDANPGTQASPKATLTAAANAATDGGQVRVKAGVYYDSLIVTKKISIVGEPGAIIDGSRADIRNTTWTQFASTSTYFLTNIRPMPYVVSVGPQRTLFHAKSLKDSTGRTGLLNWTLGGYYHRNDTLYVKLADGTTPTGKQMNISGISNLFEIYSDSVRVDSLTLRYWGTSRSSIGVLVGTAFSTDAEYCMVRDLTGYAGGGGLVYDNAGQQNNLVERCAMSDSMIYRYGFTEAKGTLQEFGAYTMNARNGTIRYCSVSGLFNGYAIGSAGTKTNEQPAADLECHNNTASDLSDDAYELDLGCTINVRLYNNKAYRTNNGISVAPTFTGPTYLIYNTLFNQAEGGFKQGDGGVSDSSYGYRFLYHNTVTQSGATGYRGAHSSAGGKFANNTYANNLFATGNRRIIADDTAADNYGTNEFNYDHMSTTNGPRLTWKNTSMTFHNSFRLTYGMEANGDTGTVAFRDSANYDFRPASGSAAGVDRGRRIPGINTATGMYSTTPDMGAFEYWPVSATTATKQRGGWLRRWRVRAR